MLSEYEVAKPNRNFSQLHLEYFELTFMDLKGALLVEGYRVPGKLHLNSRSLIFEPADIELPLLRFKYCDKLRLKVIPELTFKSFQTKFSTQASGSTLGKSDSNIYKCLCKEKVRDRLAKVSTSASSKSKMELACISVQKMVIIDRNPPAPYLVDRCDKEALFEIEDKDKTELFLRYYDEISKSNEDEDFQKGFVANLVTRKMKKYISESKEKVFYYAPCKLVQLFEQFYGFVVIKTTKILEFIPIVNVTKNVELRIPVREIKYLNEHRYMFKPVGLEIFIYNSSESYLFTFGDQNARDTIKEILNSNAPKILDLHMDQITRSWMNGVLSNYDYLIFLNRFSSRSFNDISQYPIFPWVISEFNDDVLKLNSKNYYRDLSKPIGALNKTRMVEVRRAFEKQQRDKCKKHQPHHFNSFYSTPGYVIYFYMRAIPELILKLQNGPFGPSERIFKSLESLWLNIQSTGCNLTELIPEFYTPNKADFLMNTYHLDLGYTQEGEEIDDVQLPRWAEDIHEFTVYMKAVLESDYTSVNLHKWIDLIWGYKQQGGEAITSDNLYYHLCYEHNIEWSQYKVGSDCDLQNAYHKRALEIQISEYGQVPMQLMSHPHPKKQIKIPAAMAQQGLKRAEEEREKMMRGGYHSEGQSSARGGIGLGEVVGV